MAGLGSTETDEETESMPYPSVVYPLPRAYVCDGSHASRTMRTVTASDDPNVVLYVEVCADPVCAEVRATCAHAHNEWDETGAVLSCTFCGADGT